jgi:hypothetical protein
MCVIRYVISAGIYICKIASMEGPAPGHIEAIFFRNYGFEEVCASRRALLVNQGRNPTNE